MTTVSVFGGTGFLGQRLVRRLASEGTAVRVVVRHPDQARSTLGAAGMERVTVFCADVRDRAAVAGAVAGADAVVNAVSAYVETGGVTFEAVHEQGAETLAREAAAAGVARFVLVSGIGADPESGSRVHSLARARRTGGPGSVSGCDYRPPECHVRTRRCAVRYARPSRAAAPGVAADRRRPHPPATCLCGGRGRSHCPHPRRSRDRWSHLRTRRARGVHDARAGHDRAAHHRQTTRLVSVPFTVADLQARLFELLPNPPLTTGQVDLLKADNVASGTCRVCVSSTSSRERSRRSCRPILDQLDPTANLREHELPDASFLAIERRAANGSNAAFGGTNVVAHQLAVSATCGHSALRSIAVIGRCSSAGLRQRRPPGLACLRFCGFSRELDAEKPHVRPPAVNMAKSRSGPTIPFRSH